MTASRPDLPDEVLDQAIMWLVRLQSGYADEQAIQECLAWRQRHPLHETAWQALQNNESTFDNLARMSGIPDGVARNTLDRMQHRQLGRRRLLQVVATGLLIGGMGWQNQGTVRRWRSDHSTAVGERRSVLLADGTRVQLNTNTAINIVFDDEQRLIELVQGEVFIDTGADHGSPGGRRSFWVQTAQARLQALGTAFTVRQDDSVTRLLVEQSRVLIHQPARQQMVVAGEEYSIDAQSSRKLLHNEMDPGAWRQGQLVARSMPMQVLLTELGRYQHGWLTCDPQVAGLEVSGVFQLDDIDRALDALSHSLPVRVERFTRWWRRLVAR